MKFSMFSQPPRHTPRRRRGWPSGPMNWEPEVVITGVVADIAVSKKVSRGAGKGSANLRSGDQDRQGGVRRRWGPAGRPCSGTVLSSPDAGARGARGEGAEGSGGVGAGRALGLAHQVGAQVRRPAVRVPQLGGPQTKPPAGAAPAPP